MNKLKRSFKEIAETTSIQGIPEVYAARTVKGMVFWLVLVLATNGLTAYQVFLAVRQYMNQETGTQIEVLEKGRLFYPPVKLCYWPWIRWVNFTKVENLGIDKPTLLQAMSFVDTIYTKDEFNLTKAENDFQHVISKNGYKTLEQFYKSIAKESPPGFISSSSYLTFNSASFIGELYCYSSDINHFYELDSIGFFSQEVYKNLLGSNKPQKMEIRLGFTSTQLSDNRKMYLTDVEYGSYISSFLKRVNAPEKVMETYLNETAELFLNGFEFSVPYEFVVLDNGEATTLLPVSNQYDVRIKVDVHRFLTKPSTPCIEGKQSYPFDYGCIHTCFVDEAHPCNCGRKNFCKDLQKSNSLQDLCRYSIYDTNAKIMHAQYPSYNLQTAENNSCPLENLTSLNLKCFPKCQLKGCEVWRVDIFKNELPFFSDHYVAQNHYVSIRLSYPLEDNIFVVKEVETAQWYDIISNIGGLLGIWMGASILSYVHVLYVFCDCDGFGNKLQDEIRHKHVEDEVVCKH